jgi:hypoxanthine phosphoribosyltransferase
MLQPPGALLRYLISGWTMERRRDLVQALSISSLTFEKLLLGARPFVEDQYPVISEACGVPASTFRQLEQEFTAWCGRIWQSDNRINGPLRDQKVRKRFSAEEVIRRVAALALEMSNLPKDNLLIIPILKGAFIFSADLIRFLFALGIDPLVEFLELSSYDDERVQFNIIETSKSLSPDAVWEKTVLIIDDICDTGATLDFASKRLKSLNAAKVLTCVLIDKHERRAPHLRDFQIDYVGFKISRADWMVGYGMDDKGRLRGSSDVGAIPASGQDLDVINQ